MEKIIDEILDKVHEFGMKHHGKNPNWLYLNHEHMIEIMKTTNYIYYVEMDYTVPYEGHPKTILGMQYQVKEDLTEMEVQ